MQTRYGSGNRQVVAVLLALALIASTVVPLMAGAAVAQAQCPGPSPLLCNANALSISSIGPDKSLYHNGEYAYFTVMVRNRDSSECDVTGTRVWFTQPASDGTANGDVGNLTVNHTFHADGVDDTTYTYSGGTHPILRYLINANYGVLSMSVRAQADGLLNNGKLVLPCDRATDLKEVSITLLWPDVQVTKVANTTFASVGETVRYTITITNTSLNTPLTPVSVTDTLLGDLMDGGIWGAEAFSLGLGLGEFEVGYFDYVVQVGDPDPLPNTVTAVYEDVTGYDVSDYDDEEVDLADFIPACVSNYVWIDGNLNGIQDPIEPGLNGVTVRLYQADGTPLGSMSTSGGGFYEFCGLAPGDYYLVFVPPYKYHFTSRGAGNDTGLDSNADPLSGQTEVFTLSEGEHNVTLDAGLFREPPSPPGGNGHLWMLQGLDLFEGLLDYFVQVQVRFTRSPDSGQWELDTLNSEITPKGTAVLQSLATIIHSGLDFTAQFSALLPAPANVILGP